MKVYGYKRSVGTKQEILGHNSTKMARNQPVPGSLDARFLQPFDRPGNRDFLISCQKLSRTKASQGGAQDLCKFDIGCRYLGNRGNTLKKPAVISKIHGEKNNMP